MTRLSAVATLLAVAALAAGCASASHVTSGQLHAIRGARHAYNGLAIFPAAPKTIRCSIPRGGLVLPGTPGIPGRCTTSVGPASSSGETKVEFFERGTYPASGNVASIALSGRWVVTVSRAGHVLGYSVTGDPPQLEK